MTSPQPQRTRLYLATTLLALTALAGAAQAEEPIELESTIIGSQEQPKVLYIIPWKQADSLQKIDGGLPQTIDDVFEHQEYSELQREMENSGQDNSDSSPE
ncbi:hypothetical protein [Microbulbifer sp. M83]|uniref:hypothetical protein n=1 Tax=Microbulbifer sp. M83 TaxID=3118246 RepID=UPI002FE0671A